MQVAIAIVDNQGVTYKLKQQKVLDKRILSFSWNHKKISWNFKRKQSILARD
jgi:hypothetical protein